MSEFYKDRYDVIIIGASLAGLSTALVLANKGLDVLVLEQHNLPGGVATSYIRGKEEFEASLHEMMSIGPKEHPMMVRSFLEEYDVDVEWVRIKDAFHLISKDIDFTLTPSHCGDYGFVAKQIADYCSDKDGSIYKKLEDLFLLSKKIKDASDDLTFNHVSNFKIMKSYPELISYGGYSVKEVFDKFGLDKKTQDILSAYWIYLGSPINELPFVPYAYLLADYLGYGAYIPKHTSYELSLRLCEKVMELGIQVEFSQKVAKIRTKNRKIVGITLENGTSIDADIVVCGAYPHVVYKHMIEPLSDVDKKALKMVNAMETGVSCFSLVMLLDDDYQNLGIKDYSTFVTNNELDTSYTFESGYHISNWDFLTAVCPNVIIKDASRKGTCIYSITYLPHGLSLKDLKAEEYESF